MLRRDPPCCFVLFRRFRLWLVTVGFFVLCRFPLAAANSLPALSPQCELGRLSTARDVLFVGGLLPWEGCEMPSALPPKLHAAESPQMCSVSTTVFFGPLL